MRSPALDSSRKLPINPTSHHFRWTGPGARVDLEVAVQLGKVSVVHTHVHWRIRLAAYVTRLERVRG